MLLWVSLEEEGASFGPALSSEGLVTSSWWPSGSGYQRLEIEASPRASRSLGILIIEQTDSRALGAIRWSGGGARAEEPLRRCCQVPLITALG